MSLYNLPKDVLVKLISTIRRDALHESKEKICELEETLEVFKSYFYCTDGAYIANCDVPGCDAWMIDSARFDHTQGYRCDHIELECRTPFCDALCPCKNDICDKHVLEYCYKTPGGEWKCKTHMTF